MFRNACLLVIVSLSLLACTPTHLQNQLEVAQGKRDFDSGYYKKALHRLLPVACEGDAEAQYAIGYMYYYGLGVAQDTETGYFWIQRAANQNYEPAVKALQTIEKPASSTQTKQVQS